MEFGIQVGSPRGRRTGCVIVGVFEGEPPAAALEAEGASAVLARVLRRGDLDGELGATLFLQDVPELSAERVLLVGLGARDEFGETGYREALCAAIRALRDTGTVEATIRLEAIGVNGRDAAWKAEHAVQSVMDGLYRFDRLKSRAPEPKAVLEKVILQVANRSEATAAHTAIDRGMAIAEGITLARDLGNLPANICTPGYLADHARELGARHRFSVEILERPQLEKLGMGGFLAVARGSREPPKLILMQYRGGARNAAPVVLVGKGITFDSGGICIKPASQLDEMKFDMCGAASVFGALLAAARMKLPLNVVGIVPATENMLGGNAIKPGDVVTTMSGHTVEVLDTDSEGRVVLCDALTYARRYEPAAIIDVATLTGAIVHALGDVASGLFANDDALAREILDAGRLSWDRAWHMPLWPEYQHTLKSNFADFPNIGTHDPDAITGACFLSRFTKGMPWAHLDIAGTASRGGDEKGATGRPVALLVHFLAARAGLEA